jgi:hypothetical protein
MPAAGGATHPFWSRVDDLGQLADAYGDGGVYEAVDSPSLPLGVTRDALTVITSWASTGEPSVLSFNELGARTLDIRAIDAPQAVAVDCAGNVVVAGLSNVDGMTEITVSRFDPLGELDQTFGGGLAHDSHPTSGKGISRVLIDPKGRIIVGGAEPDRFVVERYLP